MEKLIDTIDSFGRPRVVLVGDFLLDEYVYGDVERISPEAPVPILRVDRREQRNGGAGNVAAMVAALGGKVDCVGLVGDDPSGRALTGLLADAGADPGGLVVCKDRPTIVKTRYVGLAQHKNPHQILRVDEERTDSPNAETHRALLDAVRRSLQQGCTMVTIQDHDKGVLGDGRSEEIIAAVRDAGVVVAVDPALIHDYTRYRGATLLTPNRYEAAHATGIEISDEQSLNAAAEKLIEITEARTVIITLDREGAFLYPPGGPGRYILPARLHEVSDGVGAGDAVMAMLTLAIAAGGEYDQSVALANVTGGLEVERFGVVPVTREEIKDELRAIIGLRRSKIMDCAALGTQVQRLRSSGATIVFTNGCFDLLHMGHVRYLQQAREQGTCLVVAINSDDSARRLKGPQRPVIGQGERAGMLAALECIDYVTIFEEDTPETLLELLRPDVLVKGGSTDVIVGQEFVEGYGGKVKHLDMVDGMSTTDIINRIVEKDDGK